MVTMRGARMEGMPVTCPPNSEVIMKFTVKGEPQGKARARTVTNKYTGKTMSYTPHKTADYEELVRLAYLKEASTENFIDREKPVSVSIVAYYGIPKSTSKSRALRMVNGELLPLKKPDADNVAKIICDALNGLAWHDDAQVVDLAVHKVYACREPKVEVWIEEYAEVPPWDV